MFNLLMLMRICEGLRTTITFGSRTHIIIKARYLQRDDYMLQST